MSSVSDALHEAIVGAVRPFVGSIGAGAVGTALDFGGAVFGGHLGEQGQQEEGPEEER